MPSWQEALAGVFGAGRTSVDFSAGRAGAQRGRVGGTLVGARGGAMPHYRVTGYIQIDDEDMVAGPFFLTTLT